ncbi:MAG: helix-turn-helix transcriptional regulator [Chitinophagaceae bacterium]|nr:helix-turn-helix transcriptional regulator [Rubrivivax sp.]
MFEITPAAGSHLLASALMPALAGIDTRDALPHSAPPQRHVERRDGGDFGHWLSRMLDEIDYGMLLVSAEAQVLYANHAARHELDGQHPLQMLGHSLSAQRTQDGNMLLNALAAAQRGLRRLLTLGEGEHRVSISVVPLPCSAGEGGRADAGQTTLLVLGRRQMCAALSVQGFARSMALTPTETRVLELLCNGVRPTEIATRQGVAVSTVRTQIGSIRAKTGAGSIRELVRQVALLPPLVGALRSGLALAGR